MSVPSRIDSVPRRSHASRGLDAKVIFAKMLIADLEGCDRERIKDPVALRRFAVQLTALLDAHADGDALVELRCQDDPVLGGYTVIQLTEAGMIICLISDVLSRAHIQMVGGYGVRTPAALDFCEQFFRAASTTYTELTC